MKTNQISKSKEKTFSFVKKHVYDRIGFEFTNFLINNESREYEACTFEMDGLKVISRSAKITPTKTGQFVTLWKRSAGEPIQPYDVADDFDLVVINVAKDNHLGQFVFPKSVLLKQQIISSDEKEGKRGFRVYPPWDVTMNKQAQKSQKWQLDYFLFADLTKSIDSGRANKLYFRNNR
tara:strand:- start:49 stop:582 length:534 start_codon:yes stop_codon:yes gene_type:complete